jgi:hypothetical protein
MQARRPVKATVLRRAELSSSITVIATVALRRSDSLIDLPSF